MLPALSLANLDLESHCSCNYWHLQVDVPSCFVGLVLELENDRLPYPNHGHVILADPSPILFYPISGTEIRCLVDVPGQKLPSLANGDMANYLKTVIAPQVCAISLHGTNFLKLQNIHSQYIKSVLFFYPHRTTCFWRYLFGSSQRVSVIVSIHLYRYRLSYMMHFYLQLIRDILKLCQTGACQLLPILHLELCC